MSESILKISKQFIIISLFLGISLFCSKIYAQEFHRSFVDWNVFSIQQGLKKVCYIVSLPIETKGSYHKRGEPYL